MMILNFLFNINSYFESVHYDFALILPLFFINFQSPIDEWPICDCLIAFHSKGFPLTKTIEYANLRNPYIINNLEAQFDIQDRRMVYQILENAGIEIPRYAILDRDDLQSKYSCNNITMTLIQISHLFHFGFFSKTSHQMII